ncbi:MAG: hypothetical protein KF745_01840 [Phycisphaeraceae bacterium]|nr:hypothetical protein [Phycisphaeraceae bacterium]
MLKPHVLIWVAASIIGVAVGVWAYFSGHYPAGKSAFVGLGAAGFGYAATALLVGIVQGMRSPGPGKHRQ